MLVLVLVPPTVTATQGFEGRKMRPAEFREQLWRSLHLRLSAEEVHALMGVFDSDGDGYIECHEFVLHFFSAAFRLRSEQRNQELEAMAVRAKA